jgi:hypothetical protein
MATLMPRFYLHLRDGEKVFRDPTGIDVPDLQAAQQVVLDAARDFVADRLMEGKALGEQQCEIWDDKGRFFARILLREAFKIPAGRRGPR